VNSVKKFIVRSLNYAPIMDGYVMSSVFWIAVLTTIGMIIGIVIFAAIVAIGFYTGRLMLISYMYI
jgi:hypothetical protein